MLDTFKARLKAKYPTLKFTQKRIDTIAEKLNKKFPDITDEAEHDTNIDNYYDEDSLKEIVKLDEVFENAGKNKPVAVLETVQVEEKPKTEIEELREMVKTLATSVQTLSADKQAQTIIGKIKEKLKDIPEKFYENWQKPEKDEDIEGFATKVIETHAELFPKVQGGYQPGKAQGGVNNKPNEKILNNMVDELMGVQHTNTN